MSIKDILHLPADRLKRVVALKTEIEKLEQQLENVIVAASPSFVGKVIRTRRKMSAAAKAKIAAGARARWARFRGELPAKGAKPKRQMSAAARRKIAAAAKARWAKAKAAGKKHL